MKKNYILLSFIFLLSINTFAQNNGDEKKTSSLTPDMFPKTPESSGLSKAQDIPAGNYTGVANFTIPIYEIDFEGTKIPIQLSYSTKGVTVNEIATRVGLGWSLDTGASLSQQVIGTPDFIKTGNRPNVNPITFDPKNNETDKQLAREVLDILQGIKPQDLQPDIFNYSIISSGGHFIVENNGINGMPMPFNNDKITRSQFGVVIVNQQGIKHNFISDMDAVKTYNSCVGSQSFEYNDPNYKINSIVSPNNRQVLFYYEESINANYLTSINHSKELSRAQHGALPPRFGDSPETCYNITQNKEKIITKIKFPNGEILFNYVNSLNGATIRKDLPGDKILNKIIVKNNFGTIIREYNFSYKYIQSTESFVQDPLRTYLNGVDFKLFLTEVKELKSQSTYKLEYYEGNKFPTRISNNQDYWGVFNGKENNSPYPTIVNFTDLNGIKRNFYGANKSPDLDYAKIGNLRKIIYPTKGFTEVQYELDDYYDETNIINQYEYEEFNQYASTDSNAITTFDFEGNAIDGYFRVVGNPTSPSTQGGCKFELKNLTTNTKVFETDKYGNWSVNNLGAGSYQIKVIPPTMYNYDCEVEASYLNVTIIPGSAIGYTGNLRVQSIVNNDGKGKTIARDFTYKNPFTGKSSGKNFGQSYFTPLVYDAIGFKPDETTVHHNNWLEKINITNNPGWQTATVRGKSVGYEYVQEIYKGNGIEYKKQYKFDNSPLNDYEYVYQPHNNKPQIHWPFSGFHRGELQEVIEYNSMGNEVKKETYIPYYSAELNKGPLGNKKEEINVGISIKYGASPGERPFIFEPFFIKNYWIKNLKKITEEKVTGRIIKTEEEYKYNDNPIHPYVSSTVFTNSEGDVLRTEMYYPQDLIGDDFSQDLVDRNILSTPIIVKDFVKRDNKDNKVSEKKTTYKKFTSQNLLLPEFIFLTKGAENINTTTDKEITFNSYDEYGNITQFSVKDKVTSIIWGYNKMYPVAKIEGLAISSIDSGKINAIASELTQEGMATKLKELIDSYPQAMITGYVYEPLKGVTQIISPNLQSLYYEYDAYGRLEKVFKEDENGVKKPVSTKEYNYKN